MVSTGEYIDYDMLLIEERIDKDARLMSVIQESQPEFDIDYSGLVGEMLNYFSLDSLQEIIESQMELIKMFPFLFEKIPVFPHGDGIDFVPYDQRGSITVLRALECHINGIDPYEPLRLRHQD